MVPKPAVDATVVPGRRSVGSSFPTTNGPEEAMSSSREKRCFDCPDGGTFRLVPIRHPMMPTRPDTSGGRQCGAS